MINKFFAPLAQFDIIERAPGCCYDIFPLLGRYIEFDTILWLTTAALLYWQWKVCYNTKTTRVYPLIDFDDENIVKDTLNSKNALWKDWSGLLFCLIFFFNFTGMVPYSLTITAQVIMTFALALMTMLTVWFQGFYNNKIMMLNHFIPNGAPLMLAPFIILIELISNFSRIISLPVRLFANMTSGHALLKILAGAGVGAFVSASAAWGGIIILPWIVITLISLLELMIAFLQTYVFVTLVLIYVSELEH